MEHPLSHAALYYERAGTVAAGICQGHGPGPGEVEVEVAYNGICGTDLHIFHGHMDARVGPPAVIGHEMSGRIVATGPGADPWAVGDHVTVMPLRWCGACPACAAGHQHICHNLDFVGIDSPGALQQRWTVPADLLVALPAELPLDVAALTEPLAVAVHDVRRSGAGDGDCVVVIGGGPIGVLVGLVARHAGAGVVLSEPDEGRRRLAAELGLDVVDPATSDLAGEIRERTDGVGADVAFEVSGTQAGVDALTAVLKVRGVGVVVAIHTGKPAVDLFQMFWRELDLRGARVYERQDFEAAVDLLATGVVPAAQLITHVLPAHRGQTAFETLEQGGPVMKVLIDCREFGHCAT